MVATRIHQLVARLAAGADSGVLGVVEAVSDSSKALAGKQYVLGEALLAEGVVELGLAELQAGGAGGGRGERVAGLAGQALHCGGVEGAVLGF